MISMVSLQPSLTTLSVLFIQNAMPVIFGTPEEIETWLTSPAKLL